MVYGESDDGNFDGPGNHNGNNVWIRYKEDDPHWCFETVRPSELPTDSPTSTTTSPTKFPTVLPTASPTFEPTSAPNIHFTLP